LKVCGVKKVKINQMYVFHSKTERDDRQNERAKMLRQKDGQTVIATVAAAAV